MYARNGDILQFVLENPNRDEPKYTFLLNSSDVEEYDDSVVGLYPNGRYVERDFHRFNVVFSEIEPRGLETNSRLRALYPNRPFSNYVRGTDEE